MAHHERPQSTRFKCLPSLACRHCWCAPRHLAIVPCPASRMVVAARVAFRRTSAEPISIWRVLATKSSHAGVASSEPHQLPDGTRLGLRHCPRTSGQPAPIGRPLLLQRHLSLPNRRLRVASEFALEAESRIAGGSPARGGKDLDSADDESTGSRRHLASGSVAVRRLRAGTEESSAKIDLRRPRAVVWAQSDGTANFNPAPRQISLALTGNAIGRVEFGRPAAAGLVLRPQGRRAPHHGSRARRPRCALPSPWRPSNPTAWVRCVTYLAG